MRTYSERCEFPYTVEQIFDLVADVESYPDFVPGWREARIVQRRREWWLVEQVIGAGNIRFTFSSQAVLIRPECIRIRAVDGPLQHLAVNWSLEAVKDFRCSAHMQMAFAMRSPVLEMLASGVFSDMARRSLTAFERRAQHIY